MTGGEIFAAMTPLVGTLLFALSWLIRLLTGIEHRITTIEILLRLKGVKKQDEETSDASIA